MHLNGKFGGENMVNLKKYFNEEILGCVVGNIDFETVVDALNEIIKGEKWVILSDDEGELTFEICETEEETLNNINCNKEESIIPIGIFHNNKRYTLPNELIVVQCF
jgi:hypothetical protein